VILRFSLFSAIEVFTSTSFTSTGAGIGGAESLTAPTRLIDKARRKISPYLPLFLVAFLLLRV
jgi:hypothetical protein